MTHSAKRDFRGSGWGFILACIGSAVGMAASQRFGRERPGRRLALLPAAGSPAPAIGYSAVVGWIFKYLIHALRGTLRAKPPGPWFYPMAKYVFRGLALLVLIPGVVYGGIG